MAKKSAIEKNKRRQRVSQKYAVKRAALLAIIKDLKTSPAERFKAQQKLDSFPADAYRVRVRNRCLVTGRPRGYYRKFGMSRIALRDNASIGVIPGVTKSSW